MQHVQGNYRTPLGLCKAVTDRHTAWAFCEVLPAWIRPRRTQGLLRHVVCEGDVDVDQFGLSPKRRVGTPTSLFEEALSQTRGVVAG